MSEVKDKAAEQITLKRGEVWLLRVAAATGVLSMLSHGLDLLHEAGVLMTERARSLMLWHIAELNALLRRCPAGSISRATVEARLGEAKATLASQSVSAGP